MYELEFHESEVVERSTIHSREYSNGVLVYPNPSNGEVSITSERGFKEVKILTLDGKLMFHNSFTVATHNLFNISLNKGVYVVKIDLEDGNSITKKIVILD